MNHKREYQNQSIIILRNNENMKMERGEAGGLCERRKYLFIFLLLFMKNYIKFNKVRHLLSPFLDVFFLYSLFLLFFFFIFIFSLNFFVLYFPE